MSINVELLDDAAPFLVSPYESFFFLLPRVKLTVESGKCVSCSVCVYCRMCAVRVERESDATQELKSLTTCHCYLLCVRAAALVCVRSGYPGQGGCFYGHEGRCFVSQYRVVYVSDTPGYTAYRSFSLPFYCIRDWGFHVSLFGASQCADLCGREAACVRSVDWRYDTWMHSQLRCSVCFVCVYVCVCGAGAKAWRGHVNPVPGGGLVSIGSFALEFLVRDALGAQYASVCVAILPPHSLTTSDNLLGRGL